MNDAHRDRLSSVARLSLVLLAFALPFETLLFSAGPLRVTSLEALLALVVLPTALVLARGGLRPAGPIRWTFPRSWLALWTLFVVGILLSTLLAPEHQLNAAKASARILSGMALALCIPFLLHSSEDILRVVIALLLGGFISVVAGFVEIETGAGLAALNIFRVAPTSVGPFIRLTGSFDHANQTAMFLEATLPLLLALTLILQRRRSWLSVATGSGLVIWLQAAIFTYSRASIATICLSGLVVAVLLWRRDHAHDGRGMRNLGRSLPWAVLAGGIVVFFGLNALFDPVVRMRLRTEGDNEWYALDFDVPETLTVDAGQTVTTTITVRNEGALTWTSAAPIIVQLGGHWYLPEDDQSLAFQPRWRLPEPVSPGEAVTMRVGLRAPLNSGVYRFHWDMVQEHVTWFSYKNGVRASTLIRVEHSTAPAPPQDATQLALSRVVEAPADLAPIPGRRTLWRIAAEELLQRPLFGIGMDNFRLIYGRDLDFQQWNISIHTNSWYVEFLVSLGFLGALPFFAWMMLVGLEMVRALRHPQVTVWRAALAFSLLAFFLHGAVDYFLSANSTGLLFWLLSGLWVMVDNEPASVV